MTTRELVEAGSCSFNWILNFNGEQILKRVVAFMEREDGTTEKVVSKDMGKTWGRF